jgi:predicted HD phosphohydrolase
MFRVLQTLFRARGQAPYGIGDPLSIEQHSLQSWRWMITQYVLQQRDPKHTLFVPSSALWLAALTHDVGHMLLPADINPLEPGAVDDHHEKLGAAWLKKQGLHPAVYEPVALHVEAKRYMVALEDDYYDGLTAASRASLALQGGPMSVAEMNAFEVRPWSRDALLLRLADDAAKNAGHPQLQFETMVGGEKKFNRFVQQFIS